VLDAVTKGMFSTSLTDFVGVTENLNYNASSKYDGINNSWEITLPELARRAFGGSDGIASSSGVQGIGNMVKSNLKKNGGMMVAQLVLIPIAFKFGQKMLGKSLIRPANRLLAPAGVKI
jgi:hypothetical protein